jgi:hypothetical protein
MNKPNQSLFREDGSPRYVACFEKKHNPTFDRFTVVFTHTHRAGYPPNTVLYRGMSEHPTAPQGFGQWGEADRSAFSPGGSRIPFAALPPDCQAVIRNDYRDVWKLTE